MEFASGPKQKPLWTEFYYSEEEVADLIGISVPTLRNRHSKGVNHPPRTPEGRYRKTEFHEWDKSRQQRQIKGAS